MRLVCNHIKTKQKPSFNVWSSKIFDLYEDLLLPVNPHKTLQNVHTKTNQFFARCKESSYSLPAPGQTKIGLIKFYFMLSPYSSAIPGHTVATGLKCSKPDKKNLKTKYFVKCSDVMVISLVVILEYWSSIRMFLVQVK